MALTYTESSTLMTNIPFRGRIKVSTLKYANYIMDEAPSVPGHSARLRWSQRAFQMPDQEAQNLQGPVVMDAGVQEAGIEPSTGDSKITDAGLQSAVEGIVNKMV